MLPLLPPQVLSDRFAWIDGGITSSTNAGLCCDRHHNVLHQPGWKAVLEGTTIRVDRPDGTEVV